MTLLYLDEWWVKYLFMIENKRRLITVLKTKLSLQKFGIRTFLCIELESQVNF